MKRKIDRITYMLLGAAMLYIGGSKYPAITEAGWYSALYLFLIIIGASVILWNFVYLVRR